MKKSIICGVEFDCITLNEVLDYIEVNIKKNPSAKLHIHTANVDHLVLVQKDKEFLKAINSSNIVTCDGMPIVWISKFYKNKLPERVTGADLSEKIILESNSRNYSVYLLGAKPGVAEKAISEMRDINSQIQIAGYYSPNNEELTDQTKVYKIINMINESKANILLVALGSPKQEKWINMYRNYLLPTVTIGVGASFDFMAGEVKRAPKVIRENGFEWLYRLFQEPKRLWKRYILNDTKLIYYIIFDLLRGKDHV